MEQQIKLVEESGQEVITGMIAEYNPFRSQLAELKELNKRLAFDYESPEGQKGAEDHIKKIKKSRAALEKVRKEIAEPALRRKQAIDSEAREIKLALEDMINEHQKPLDEIEQRNQARITAIQSRIADIEHRAECAGFDSKQCADSIAYLNAIEFDGSFEEFDKQAREAVASSLEALTKQHDYAAQSEKQAAELVEAQRKAEEAERKERERIEAERQKAEVERLQKEADERARITAEAEATRRIKEAEDAKQKAIDEAKAEAERVKQEAERKERERLAAIEAEKAEAARRSADIEHRKAVNNAAVKVLLEAGITEAQAKEVVTLIAQGAVPNVSIRY